MTQYTVNFKNNTDSVWTMSLYQLIPSNANLDSVSWQQTTAPPHGNGSPPISWDSTYNVVLGTCSQQEATDCYHVSQILQCDLGTSWDIIFKDNVKQLVQSGVVRSDHIVINNKSGLIANPGIGMSGYPSVYNNNVLSGISTLFIANPSYWVGLFNELSPGDVIADNIIAGPLQLNFSTNITQALLTANITGQTLLLDLSYSVSP
jgi:rhizosphere induced protein